MPFDSNGNEGGNGNLHRAAAHPSGIAGAVHAVLSPPFGPYLVQLPTIPAGTHHF